MRPEVPSFDISGRSSRSRLTVRAAIVLVSALTVAVMMFVFAGARSADSAEFVGTAKLALADGTAIGTVTFLNEPGEEWTTVRVALKVPVAATSLRTFHGFHIHANDTGTNGNDCIADPKAPANTWFVSADGHWRRNPGDAHGDHAGDMTSVYLNRDGRANMEFTIDRLIPSELFNRAVIVHAGPDNFGNVPVGTQANQYSANTTDAIAGTRNTGNAGDRIACGTVDTSRS
jgi:superoxide dismutase, Cu-Zn family